MKNTDFINVYDSEKASEVYSYLKELLTERSLIGKKLLITGTVSECIANDELKEAIKLIRKEIKSYI